MAIAEILSRTRTRIACFGGIPLGDEGRSFLERGLLVTPCTEDDLRDTAYLSGVAAVVFTQNIKKYLSIVPLFEEHAKRLLDHDCSIFVRLAPDGRSIIINTLNRLELPSAGLSLSEQDSFDAWMPKRSGNPPPPFLYVCDTAIDWAVIANLISETPFGKAPNFDLIVDSKDEDGKEIKFSSSNELLIRRAFWDCAEVHLVPMLDGLSDVLVYRAYAELAKGHYGKWPRPYFVKIGKRAGIFAEYKNYEDGVRPYIPFHLGPHLVHDRCCLGAEDGIIVGDFVEESESLRDCASDGRAAAAIACLFNSTLRGWYLHAQNVQSPLTAYLLPHFPEKIPENREARARELGATKTLSDLRVLFEKCTFSPVLVGPIHGDLHATNVLVRSADAIIIDFQKHCENPIVYDAACLEAGLLVDGFSDDKRDEVEWINSIMPLYRETPLHSASTRCHPSNQSSWYYACIHQIRLYARRMQHYDDKHGDQYAAALALALLKKASNKKQFVKLKESRRAGAYVIAELILTRISSGISRPPEL
ncbi:MAG: phosphotransferase [Gammaproteobacteria bacterium]|nr:phosphotransferase [Gammaproteobacteria bacterium]